MSDSALGQARRDLLALLEGETDLVSRMSTVCAVLFERMANVSFCGFYRMIDASTLAVGPYQGPVGCLRIELGRGVCGTAAAEKRALLVDDIRLFPGHIACDPAARSELVVPVMDKDGALLAVLDLDSQEVAAFDDNIREEIVDLLRELFGGATPSSPMD